MNIYIIIVLAYTMLFILANPDGWLRLKLFDRRLNIINRCCKLYNIDCMADVFIYESKHSPKCLGRFKVRIENEECGRIGYFNAYSATAVYINDEKVCVMHRLHKDAHIDRRVEYAKDRCIKEIDEIIMQVYKDAKRVRNKYYDEYMAKKNQNKSFYNK